MLRDGIEDYEYLVMLRKKLEARGHTLARGELDKFEALLQVPPAVTSNLKTFTKDPAPIEARRHEIARAIEALENKGRP